MLALRSSRLLPLAAAAAIGLAATPAHAHEPSRWIAALPFGVGQFQNGDVGLGVTFATGQTLLGATSIASAVMVAHLSSAGAAARHPSTGRPVDLTRLNGSIRAATTVNHIAFASWAALAVAGVIEAQVSFAPQRATPASAPLSRVRATAAPLPGGAFVGLSALF